MRLADSLILLFFVYRYFLGVDVNLIIRNFYVCVEVSSLVNSKSILCFEPDVLPIETARVRFLQIFVDHFIQERVREVPDLSDANYANTLIQEKATKRKMKEVEYEGDPNFALPLMYVANLYETLASEVNVRLASLDGIRDKTIGVALEAAGGLYRRLAKKFPRKGHTWIIIFMYFVY